MKSRKTKIKGAGDVIKIITDTVGIEQCDGCEERQAKLNDAIPFTKQGKLTEMDCLTLKRLVKENGLAELDKKFVTDLYNKVFDAKEEHCASCNPITYQFLNKLWEYYQEHYEKKE
jgi:hypothetical protein